MAKKKTIKKKVAKKKVTKKAVIKTAKKKLAKKKVAKKKTTKKTSKKAIKKTPKKKVANKKTTKKATKKTTKKVVKKKTTTKKTTKKKVTSKKPVKKAAKDTAKKTTVRKRRRRGFSVSDAAREEEADAQGFVYVNGRKIRMIVSNGLLKKKRRSKEKLENPIKKIISLKTQLNAKQLRAFRDKLLVYRERLLSDLGAIEKEALNIHSDVGHMPIHMADVGSDAYDQDLKLGMAASERKRVRDIEEALIRIKKKTYGICHLTGDKIPEARLLAKPWAKYTVVSAEIIERRTRRK